MYETTLDIKITFLTIFYFLSALRFNKSSLFDVKIREATGCNTRFFGGNMQSSSSF
jgi:hypothetical protein